MALITSDYGQVLGTRVSELRMYNAHTMLKSKQPTGSTAAAHGEQPHYQFGEQGLHQDYSNNSLVVPPRDPFGQPSCRRECYSAAPLSL